MLNQGQKQVCPFLHLALSATSCSVCRYRTVDRDSSVGIATRYGFEGPRTESWLIPDRP